MRPTLDQFCSDVAQAGLVSPSEMQAVIELLPLERKPRDAQELIRELVRLHKLTVYQAQQIYQGQAKRLHLGNYVVLDKIGQGGMGMVLKAEHKRMRRIVALKVIRPRSIDSPSALKRFHREVETAAQLIHPNIVTAYDADEADGTHFLVMEYVDGTDLSTLVKLEGGLPLETALSCVMQAARGLEYAHSKGIIHRDIKPRNLLLSPDGNLKILDMGLARVETSSGADQTDLTGSGQIMGTVDYMSPEQAINPKNADQRADIYSLGITLWYLLVGRLPFNGETVLEKLVAHREEPIPSLAVARRGVPRELDAVFQRMVAKKPQQRYASMTELIADLEQCRVSVEAAPVAAGEPQGGQELQAFLQGISSGGGSRRTGSGSSPGRARPRGKPTTGETVCDGVASDDTNHTFEPAGPTAAPPPDAVPIAQTMPTKPVEAAKPTKFAEPTRPREESESIEPGSPDGPSAALRRNAGSAQTEPERAAATASTVRQTAEASSIAPAPQETTRAGREMRKKPKSLAVAVAIYAAAVVAVALAVLALAALGRNGPKRRTTPKSTAGAIMEEVVTSRRV
jgi:serine/threonine protein kinase